MHACIYVYIHVRTHTHTYMHTYIHTHTHIYIYIYVLHIFDLAPAGRGAARLDRPGPDAPHLFIAYIYIYLFGHETKKQIPNSGARANKTLHT